MIKLFRLPPENPARSWLAEREIAAISGLLPHADRSYGDTRVKAALRSESHDKCSYCESTVSGIYYGDVDHIKPKAIFPDLSLNYENLLFACAICNNFKRDFFSPTTPLIDPYNDSISEHLRFAGPSILPNNSSVRGRTTIDKLKLNRPELLSQRFAVLDRFSRTLETIGLLPEGDVRAALAELLRSSIEDCSEYAAMCRTLFTT